MAFWSTFMLVIGLCLYKFKVRESAMITRWWSSSDGLCIEIKLRCGWHAIESLGGVFSTINFVRIYLMISLWLPRGRWTETKWTLQLTNGRTKFFLCGGVGHKGLRNWVSSEKNHLVTQSCRISHQVQFLVSVEIELQEKNIISSEGFGSCNGIELHRIIKTIFIIYTCPGIAGRWVSVGYTLSWRFIFVVVSR